MKPVELISSCLLGRICLSSALETKENIQQEVDSILIESLKEETSCH